MNNEELESKLLLIKQSIDALQEELAPNLKTKDLVYCVMVITLTKLKS